MNPRTQIMIFDYILKYISIIKKLIFEVLECSIYFSIRLHMEQTQIVTQITATTNDPFVFPETDFVLYPICGSAVNRSVVLYKLLKDKFGSDRVVKPFGIADGDHQNFII